MGIPGINGEDEDSRMIYELLTLIPEEIEARTSYIVQLKLTFCTGIVRATSQYCRNIPSSYQLTCGIVRKYTIYDVIVQGLSCLRGSRGDGDRVEKISNSSSSCRRPPCGDSTPCVDSIVSMLVKVALPSWFTSITGIDGSVRMGHENVDFDRLPTAQVSMTTTCRIKNNSWTIGANESWSTPSSDFRPKTLLSAIGMRQQTFNSRGIQQSFTLGRKIRKYYKVHSKINEYFTILRSAYFVVERCLFKDK